MEIAVAVVYCLALLYLFLFSMGQLHLTWIYRNTRAPRAVANEFEPFVTVQLPVYNEKYVVERLLDAIGKLAYPSGKLEVQILDDSTDETTAIILGKIESMRPLGLDIKLLHREQRTGYKAGALEVGFRSAQGEFIAIFDADFIPEPDFLRKTIPYFIDPQIGVVQTRWGHLNRDYSWLTRWQAFGLDAHFSVEQGARNAVGSFINFNGTGGIWRRTCIADAGGWQSDTLTEDLDLSYRAQLKGWKFHYREDVATPGELPVVMPAIKSQQYRWNKGGAETARKIWGQVFRSGLPLGRKLHAFFHLFNASVFVAVLAAALLSVPMLFIKAAHPELKWMFTLGTFFLVGFFSIGWFYWTSGKLRQLTTKEFLLLFPGFLIVSMGLSLHNGLAVMEGLIGRKTPFVRTPKFNITGLQDTWKGKAYFNYHLSVTTLMEGLLMAYFMLGIGIGIHLGDWGLLFFHTLLALGFGAVFFYSLKSAAHA